jgi:hypothetical protein
MIRARDIYDVIGLHRGLRLHQARTVAIVKTVSSRAAHNVAGDCADIALAMAVHDVGNMVRLPERPDDALAIMHEPADSLARWQLATKLARARYGTQAILHELGIRTDLREIIDRKSSKNFASTLSRDSFPELLALYSDMRVGPDGIIGLAERHAEATARYKGTNRVGLGGTVTLKHLLALEAQLAAHAGSSISDIGPEISDGLIHECLNLDMSDAFE